jgi:pimeloyl-ACP methyl ester carboxylesterase
MMFLSNYGLLQAWLEGESMSASKQKISVVLVHGAWADGSCWSKVIRTLQSRGLKVMAAPIPLTSLSDDIAALDRALEQTEGPVVLVAHAYAGAVISGTRNNRIRGLCFVAGLAPAEGETVAQVFYREPSHPQAPKLSPDAHGFIWMPDESFGSAFSQNATREEVALLSATQRPISVACIQQRAGEPGWSSKPSWYLVAEEDRLISPVTQRFLAERMGARIRSARVDHTPSVSAPEMVTEIIMEAVASVPEQANA